MLVKVNVHSSNIEQHIDTSATKVGCGEVSLEPLWILRWWVDTTMGIAGYEWLYNV